MALEMVQEEVIEKATDNHRALNLIKSGCS